MTGAPRGFVFSTLCAVWVQVIWAQSPKPFVPPALKGDRAVRAQAALAPSDDPTKLYKDKHESAVAALKAGNSAAALGKSNDRAINLFLLAAKRDPNYGPALYDLGVICARGERWEDALNFYKEAAQLDPSPEIIKLTTSELERVQFLASLESSPGGKRRRQFDTEFVDVANKQNEPVIALESVARLIKLDSSRWEAFALRAILEASLDHHAETAAALQSAARLAPADRRKGLNESSDLARNEAMFQDLMHNADLTWEKQEYEPAAKLYAGAWEISPARSSVGMQAAVGFLMADQVPLAVQTLARVRQIGAPELSEKATAMLKALAAISPEAAQAATSERTGPPEANTGNIADQIRKSVGDLVSPQMRLVTKPVPALLEDKTSFVDVPDPELTAKEVAYMSTESIFSQYKRNSAAALEQSQIAPPPPPVETPAALPPVPPSLPQAAPPSVAPSRPSRLEIRPESATPPKPSIPVPPAGTAAIVSQPSGGTVIFDNDPSLNCKTPCQMPLSAGRHTLKATLPNYRDILKILTIDKSVALPPMELDFELKQAIISVVSKTPGIKIYLDGKPTDQVTPARLTVMEGDHEVGLEIDGKIVTRSIHVTDGVRFELSI